MAGITDFLASKLKNLSPEKWDSFVRWLDSRFRVLEEKADLTDRVADSILARGLQVIEDGIGPSIIVATQKAAEISAIANLGMIFTAPSTTSVQIGTGTKSFTIPSDRRDQFSPAAIMMAYAGTTYENAIIGFAQSYNRATGLLTLTVIETKGSGVFANWTLTPVATTADLEALRDQVEADRLAAGENADAAESAAGNAAAIAFDFRKKYLGSLAADPTVDGNGAPVAVGALYTNTVSGKFRYFGLSGWQDTTAGSNIVRYTFTTDGRGTAAYPLPETPASKDNCFVIVGGTPQMGDAFDVSSSGISFTSDPGAGRLVEVKIIGQLAIGTPSNETVDDAKIKTSAIAAIRTKLGLDTLFAKRVQVDAAQTFTEAEKGQARANIGAGILAGVRNKIINGNFEVWQRGTFSAAAATVRYLADRWQVGATGETIEVAKIDFAPGQTLVPGEPASWIRLNFTSVAGAGNFAFMRQQIENVRTLAGKKATLTFYAKGDMPRTIAVELVQAFGFQGSPSASVTAIQVKKHVLSTGWQKFSYVVDIPSIAGKTLGTTENTSSLDVSFWFDAGATYDARTLALGKQPSGIVDIAHVSLVEGDATGEDDPFTPRHPQQELALCQRYYFKGFLPLRGVFSSTASVADRCGSTLPVPMRAAPTVTAVGVIFDGYATFPVASINITRAAATYIELVLNVTGTTTQGRVAAFYADGANNYITTDAEF